MAGLEFALCAPILLMMLAALSDFGLALRCKSQLASGVANAAAYAVLTQGAATQATLTTIVQSASGLTGALASSMPASCFCPAGSPVSMTAETCGSTCANGATTGTYVSITAQFNYSPLMVGYSFVANTRLTETVWVQVQ